MRILLITIMLTASIGFIGYGQSPYKTSEALYMPLEFKKAYEKGTRSLNGKVPEDYWQNRSKYIIKASIDPETRLIKGQANITYFNNSPDSLLLIVFQAYPDYRKPYAKRKMSLSQYEDQIVKDKGFEIEKLILENDTIDVKASPRIEYLGTNYQVNLKDPIPSGDSIDLYLEWNYVVPLKNFVRTGAIDSTSMFIAYWYPEIAVKDDIHGWDKSIYDTATEFYHDFSEYEVSLTVPDNFVVWASVAPENPEEVYDKQTLKRLEQAKKSTEAVKIITKEDFKTRSSSKTTWKYNTRDFPDFSFALSDHFLWEASMYKNKKANVFAHVVYPPAHENYTLVMPTIHRSLDLFHNTLPKYPFPHKYFTSFNGSKGYAMEFPGMMNTNYLSKEKAEQYLGRKVTDEEINRAYLGTSVHEMGHMYFPFMMGFNEKNYAWMDEGFANFLDSFLEPLWPESPFMPDPETLGSISRTPLMVTSREHEGSWINSYDVGSAMYYALYNLLGEETFIDGLHAFIEEWKYKHPTPYDMVNTLNSETEEDLNWFFDNWLFDWGYIDLEILSAEDQEIEIRNNGGKAVSFKIIMTSEKGEESFEIISPEVWKDSSIYVHEFFSHNVPSKITLEVPLKGDAVPANDHWEK